ncbi:alpha-L-rhamnosidase [Alloacidobacterium dinghuense]|uniref:Alpha-L-rhamnosidase n=1 Tax=Alloacidobacterium dinghuense TaxID=2763107 RepID=A0A7G8BP55_9BACT|nr:alpha-L-rhamnosidase C-terminal domain-containing protein [Alloacidobacterium dinghuense]QNI34325.1 alpha-L-rhamnosidase [Alloacidobacterium dinghuense]
MSRVLLFAVVLFSAAAMAAQEAKPLNPALVESKWHAHWITCPDAPQKDVGIFYFRKELTFAMAPEHFWVHVSADNRFLLHVNGQYAGEGPARGDLFHWRFETIDLAPMLKPGKNVLAATVWNFGTRAPIAQMTNRTGFLLQGDTSAEEVANTDASWQVKQEKGRGLAATNGVAGYYAAGPGETVDGRMVTWDWDAPAVSDTAAWHAAEAIGEAATREAQDADNNWELVQDQLPAMEHRPTMAGRIVRMNGVSGIISNPQGVLEIPANTHATLLFDNQVLQSAYPELTVSGGRDAEIRLTYAEALYDAKGEKGNRNEIEGRHIEGVSDIFISDGTDQRAFQPLWWRTWRYLQVDVTTKSAPLKLEKLDGWFNAYPFVERASITGDIPDLKKLWDTGWRTARLCAHETYMDAPYWEQLQYVGDTRIQALISYAVSGDSRLGKQAITNIQSSIIPEGLTQSRYPSRLPQFIPPFSLLWVDMLHDYWMYVNDEALVRETLPRTRGVIDWYALHLRDDGLMGRVKWWEFGDWTSGYQGGDPPQEADGGSTFLTAQFIEALRDAAELEQEYGSKERAAVYRKTIEKSSAALNRLNWDAEQGVYADTPAKKSYSQQANVLAVWQDVAPRAEQKAILQRVLASQEGRETQAHGKAVPPMSAMSYYFRFYLARALEHAGMADLYVSQLKPWYDMLKLGLSTWAEQPEPTRSDCHAWSAHPNYDLLTVVAGIHPGAPGFSQVRIEPHLGALHEIEASMPHGDGNIATAYRRNAKEWVATITLPGELSGKLVWNGQEYQLHPGKQEISLPIGN